MLKRGVIGAVIRCCSAVFQGIFADYHASVGCTACGARLMQYPLLGEFLECSTPLFKNVLWSVN